MIVEGAYLHSLGEPVFTDSVMLHWNSLEDCCGAERGQTNGITREHLTAWLAEHY